MGPYIKWARSFSTFFNCLKRCFYCSEMIFEFVYFVKSYLAFILSNFLLIFKTSSVSSAVMVSVAVAQMKNYYVVSWLCEIATLALSFNGDFFYLLLFANGLCMDSCITLGQRNIFYHHAVILQMKSTPMAGPRNSAVCPLNSTDGFKMFPMKFFSL